MSRPPDEPVRRLVREGLGDTLFVEAGAGTGKTSLLVDRIVNLVLEGGIPLRSIAAITFTEAAASELQSRIRSKFEAGEVEAIENGDHDRAARCAAAIDDADLAAISTLHGFANRILSEFSVAAGLPPQVRVLDEVSSQLAGEARWQRFLDGLYDDPDHADLLSMATALDIALEPRYPGQTTMRDVAVEFNQNWDRLEPLIESTKRPLPRPDVAGFRVAVDRLEAWIDRCELPGDKLEQHLRSIVPEMRAILALDDPIRQIRQLSQRRPKFWGRSSGGRKEAWPVPTKTVKDDIDEVNEAAKALLDPLADAVLLQLSAEIARETVAAARARRKDGGLEFHDLLVLARNLLRKNTDARRALHERYTHLLLDEFQDTDPIQIELAALIATDADDVEGVEWFDLPTEPGRLFFVGDPKQSIYRFRRADIALFLQARDRFAGLGGAHQLTTNFRTVEPIVDWVNALFEIEMPEEVAASQPKYQALSAYRNERFDPADHLPVLLGGPHPDPKVRSSELRTVEAADVARSVRAILDSPERFPVLKLTKGKKPQRRWGKPTLSDITILIPTRTSLPFLRAALAEAGIEHRIATGTLVYDTQEVIDALAALRAIDDPADSLSLVTALRSPLYACSDVDLYRYRQAGGRWDHRVAPPDSVAADNPVPAAMAHLNGLWRQRWFLSPSALLERLLRERRAPMLAFGAARPADVWRRLRFLVEQARAFEESSTADLRSFIDWAGLQSGPMARVHEPLLPETDQTALSIQTIHGSKGLEFPITILSGMTTKLQNNRSGVSVLWPDGVGAPEIRFRSGTATRSHEPRADLEAKMDTYERKRLLYVAATRARDHLFVSCHHKANQADTSYGGLLYAAFAQPGLQGLSRRLDLDEMIDDTPEVEPSPSQLGLALDARTEWINHRRTMLADFAESRVVSATAIAEKARNDLPSGGVAASNASATAEAASPNMAFDQDDDGADQPIDTVVPVRRRGRTGSAIGSAVHAVLEFVDFENPNDLEDLASQCAHAEAVPEVAPVIAMLARAALGTDAIELARHNRHHRELFVAAPVGERVIEGYVDLLVDTPDGLVVVDYKTDKIGGPADLDAKLATYELQAATYAVALESVTGRPVIDCRFVFLSGGQAIERSVEDLESAKQRVRQVVADDDS